MKLPHDPLLKACFWSYDYSLLDTMTHKTLIIRQVLEYGEQGAVAWLEETYDRDTIREVIAQSMVSEWTNKTRNYLGIVYDVLPSRTSRFA